jgi:hypothetical protein
MPTLKINDNGVWKDIEDPKAAHVDEANTFLLPQSIKSKSPSAVVEGTSDATNAPFLEAHNGRSIGARVRLQAEDDGRACLHSATSGQEDWKIGLAIKDGVTYTYNLQNTGNLTNKGPMVNVESNVFPRVQLHSPGSVASVWSQFPNETHIGAADGLGNELQYIAAFRNPDRTVQFASAAYATGGFHTGSDRRLKKDIKDYAPTESALSKVMRLQAKNFRYKQESDEVEQRLGFIAQEADLVIPEGVRESNHNATGVEGESENYLTVDPMAFIALQNEAIKELAGTVESLEKRLAALESK